MDDDDKPARYADDANIPPEREHDTHEAETLPAPPSEGAPEVLITQVEMVTITRPNLRPIIDPMVINGLHGSGYQLQIIGRGGRFTIK